VNDPWIDGRLFAVAECDLLAVLPWANGRPFVTTIASGRDGDWAAMVASGLGVLVARGAAGRGGTSAVEGLLRLTTPDRPVLLSVDGPLGPAGIAKPGIVSLGASCRRDVVPIAAAARWAFRFPWTWSGIYLPLPFSKVWLQAAEPVNVTGATDRLARAGAAKVITARMRDARAHAHAQVHAT